MLFEELIVYQVTLTEMMLIALAVSVGRVLLDF